MFFEEARKIKRENDQARDKTTVNIAMAFTCWRQLKVLKGCKIDATSWPYLLSIFSRMTCCIKMLAFKGGRYSCIILSSITIFHFRHCPSLKQTIVAIHPINLSNNKFYCEPQTSEKVSDHCLETVDVFTNNILQYMLRHICLLCQVFLVTRSLISMTLNMG